MDIQLLNEELLEDLRLKAQPSERFRMNFDLRTTPEALEEILRSSSELNYAPLAVTKASKFPVAYGIQSRSSLPPASSKQKMERIKIIGN